MSCILSPALIQEMTMHYRYIRAKVYEDATRPLNNSTDDHLINQAKLRNEIETTCLNADLKLYVGADKQAALKIWHHLWTKNRYGGMRAAWANDEIKSLAAIFDNYEIFSDSSWDIEVDDQRAQNKRGSFYKKPVLLHGGQQTRDFLAKRGQFAGKPVKGKLSKLCILVSIARQLKVFMETKQRSAPVLDYVTGGSTDIWNIHQHLLRIGYRGDLTALHFMMDLGFDVMKPDVVITALFLEWGWLHCIIPALPGNFSANDLKRMYTKPDIYKPVIELSRVIAKSARQDDLQDDIGWVTNNALREFDLFVVLYGQKPDKKLGIIRKLHGHEKAIGNSCAGKPQMFRV
jgi:hypothetical protein